MTFPTVVNRASARETAGTLATSHSLGAVGTLAATAGNLILVFVACDGNPTISINTAASGNDWVMVGQASNSTVVTGAVFWKVAAGSDALTVTTSVTEEMSHFCFQINPQNNGWRPQGTNANGSSTNADPPASPLFTLPGDDILWVAAACIDSTVVATVAPSSWSNLFTQAAAGTAGASVSVADRTGLNASNTNPGTFTTATEQWVTWTVGIGPELHGFAPIKNMPPRMTL